MIRVQEADFDVGAELTRLTAENTNIGGLAVFVGLVREVAGEENIGAMTLEHYAGMTEKALARIEEEAKERWPLEASLIIHRVGRLEPGDQIVLVATASAHRQAAFDACQFLIDWLKTKAPFWKQEETEAGPRWVGSRTGDDEAAERWNKLDPDAAE